MIKKHMMHTHFNYRFFFLISIILTLAACNGKQTAKQNNREGYIDGEYKVHYAKGFQVTKFEGYTQVVTRDVWDSTHITHTYILVPKNSKLPPNLPKGTIIRTPLTEVVAYSIIHCSSLNELHSLAIIKGVCQSQYISIPAIGEGVSNGSIVDIGMTGAPDMEKMLMIDPEAIFVMPASGQASSSIEKLKISIIETPDYLEPDPLGRAEWLRFYSLFVDKEQLADSLFAITEKNYNEIKQKTAHVAKRPTVFSDMRYQSSWNMPGGRSYMANMLADAGAAYIWADNTSTTFMPLSFEAVFDKAGEADIWIIKYYSASDMTYTSLKKEYKPYSYFKAFKDRQVYACNTRTSAFYEDLPIHPDYILKDFAQVFHPELFTTFESNKYYKKISD